MPVSLDTRIINRGITRTAKSLQTPNDKLGQTLLKKDENAPVDIRDIIKNQELMTSAGNFFKKFMN